MNLDLKSTQFGTHTQEQHLSKCARCPPTGWCARWSTNVIKKTLLLFVSMEGIFSPYNASIGLKQDCCRCSRYSPGGGSLLQATGSVVSHGKSNHRPDVCRDAAAHAASVDKTSYSGLYQCLNPKSLPSDQAMIGSANRPVHAQCSSATKLVISRSWVSFLPLARSVWFSLQYFWALDQFIAAAT